MAALAGCGSQKENISVDSSSGIETSPETMSEVKTSGVYVSAKDVIKELINQRDLVPQLYLYDASEIYEAYQICFSEGDLMTALLDVRCLVKDSYQPDYLESFDADSIYKGISEASYASVETKDTEEFYVIIFEFNGLDNPETLKDMIQKGYIADIGTSDTAAYGAYLTDNGAIRLDPETMEP